MAKKPRKRLKLSPEDRVIGVTPRKKRDLFAGCNEPGKQWFHPDDHVFMKTFCRLCKNADCIRAKGAISPWHTRMAEQVDYLLNDPEFSELTSETHRHLANQAFSDIGHKMARLEIAKQRQDWEIPEGPTDGFDKVAAPDTTDQFDEAAKELARARGKKEPELPRPEGEAAPAHFQTEEDEDDPYEYDTDYPSSDGSRTYHVTLDKGGHWACECDGYTHRKKCKHIDAVSQWYREQLERGEDEDNDSGGPTEEAPSRPPEPPQQPPPPRPTEAQRPPDPRVPADPRPFNTPMPQGGVMIGGGDVPPDQGQQRTSAPEKDSWAIPKEKIVEPGARVTLKGGKKKT
jgi:hypothetical protein